jgi:hypothetical protein
MGLILRQTNVQCAKDGSYLFVKTPTIYDIEKQVEVEGPPEGLCQLCNKRSYLEAIKNATVIKLIQTNIA